MAAVRAATHLMREYVPVYWPVTEYLPEALDGVYTANGGGFYHFSDERFTVEIDTSRPVDITCEMPDVMKALTLARIAFDDSKRDLTVTIRVEGCSPLTLSMG